MSAEVLEAIPLHLKEIEKEDLLLIDPSECGKTLGVHSSTQKDLLYLSMPALDDIQPTKRHLASAVASLYDVHGWFAHVTLYLKITLQHLWQSGVDWDDTIQDEFIPRWEECKSQLHSLSSHSIPRCVFSTTSTPRTVQLHVAHASLWRSNISANR